MKDFPLIGIFFGIRKTVSTFNHSFNCKLFGRNFFCFLFICLNHKVINYANIFFDETVSFTSISVCLRKAVHNFFLVVVVVCETKFLTF